MRAGIGTARAIALARATEHSARFLTFAYRRTAMPSFPLYRIRTMRPALMKLLLIAAVMAAVAAMAALSQRPGRMMPDARAGEAKAAMAGTAATSPQKSWSEVWHEMHQAISNSPFAHFQAF
jgi:hypothetical protein